jgi:hypothetical protein
MDVGAKPRNASVTAISGAFVDRYFTVRFMMVDASASISAVVCFLPYSGYMLF